MMNGLAKRIATHPQVTFVILNVLVNLFFITRSYITMRVLDYDALGLVALVQSIILLVGMLQFGLVNGGYRLLCSAADAEEAQHINDAFYSGLAVLAALAILGGAATILLYDAFAFRIAGLVGAVGGIAALMRTWMMNEMLAESRLGDYNRINLISAAVSLGFLFFIPWNALLACLAAVMMQHVLFVFFSLTLGKTRLPSNITFNQALFRRIFRVGFVLFLTGVFLQLNLQVERWYVVGTLGLDALGHLYLAILFVSLFQLVPTSLSAVFLPPLVRSHDEGDFTMTRRSMTKMALSTLLYCIFTALAVTWIAEPIIRLILPGYVDDLRFVEIMLPGLLAFTMGSAFALTFNVLVYYRYYIVAYGMGSLILIVAFGVAQTSGQTLTLSDVVMLRSVSYGLMGTVIAFGYVRILRERPEFLPG